MQVVVDLARTSDEDIVRIIDWGFAQVADPRKWPNNAKTRLTLSKSLKLHLPSDSETCQIVCDSTNNIDKGPLIVEYVFQRKPLEPFNRIVRIR
jgi:hypothetical protein